MNGLTPGTVTDPPWGVLPTADSSNNRNNPPLHQGHADIPVDEGLGGGSSFSSCLVLTGGPTKPRDMR